MRRDRLFLLRPGFADPEYPGTIFYCWHCALIEGVLASFPDLAWSIDVHRIAWPRPREAIVALIGEDHQSLPVLILAEDDRSNHETFRRGRFGIVDDTDAILAALTERHGFPAPHP